MRIEEIDESWSIVQKPSGKNDYRHIVILGVVVIVSMLIVVVMLVD
jgi:hypothetical protein